jgi:hypothetical protein
MAEPIVIKFMTGVVPGADRPTICHSGKPKPHTCYAVSREPGREGSVLVQDPPSECHRDGWWRPESARQLRGDMAKFGFSVGSHDVPISGAGLSELTSRGEIT